MIRFRDTLRGSMAVDGEALNWTRALFPQPEVMERQLLADEQKFLRSLQVVVGPFLQLGTDQDKNISQLPEPVGVVLQRYLADLSLETVAAELELEDTKVLAANPKFQMLGLGPLLSGGQIKREAWHSPNRQGLYSIYQQAARELKRGTPHRER